jgi:hypothetical protein
MQRVIERGRVAAKSATVRPSVRWGGLLAIIAGALIAAFAFPKAQPKAQPVSLDAAPVLAADAALRDAIRAGDKVAARRLLALQFTLVDTDGKVHPRRELLADLKRAVRAPASNITVRGFGLVAAVTGRHKSAQDTDVFFIELWVRQKGAWRALLMQDVPIATDDTPVTIAAAASAAEPQSSACSNPCKTIPYRVRSAAEQDVVNTFQTIMRSIVVRDANEWAKHVADEFMAYASGQAPIGKSGRIDTIGQPNPSLGALGVGKVQSVRLAVYGDGAVMTATDIDDGHPSYRAARVFLKRDGRWLMAISAHTDIR